jgi:hypothetical protein
LQGIAGKDGKNGRDGVDGKNGKDGLNGIDGKDGSQGPKGDKGEKGDKGDSSDFPKIKVGNGLEFDKKKNELWLNPKQFPPVPVGQLGGAVIGGGGSNTGVRVNGSQVRGTARFIDFNTNFKVEASGGENASVTVSVIDGGTFT